MAEQQNITTLELSVRMVMYEVGATNTIPIKLDSPGKVYGDLHVGNNLELATRDGLLYLDCSAVGNAGRVPVYQTHSAAPTPPAGFVTEYLLEGDIDFRYLLWPDGSRNNRRIALDMEVDE